MSFHSRAKQVGLEQARREAREAKRKARRANPLAGPPCQECGGHGRQEPDGYCFCSSCAGTGRSTSGDPTGLPGELILGNWPDAVVSVVLRRFDVVVNFVAGRPLACYVYRGRTAWPTARTHEKARLSHVALACARVAEAQRREAQTPCQEEASQP